MQKAKEEMLFTVQMLTLALKEKVLSTSLQTRFSNPFRKNTKAVSQGQLFLFTENK